MKTVKQIKECPLQTDPPLLSVPTREKKMYIICLKNYEDYIKILCETHNFVNKKLLFVIMWSVITDIFIIIIFGLS